MPIYELKMAFSLHAHYCAEHIGEFAARVREMRQPPHGLELSPHGSLDLFFDEILSAPSVEALLLGLYERALPAVIRGLEHVVTDTNKLFDHPTYRICRLTLVEMQDVQQYGTEAVRCLVKTEKARRASGLAGYAGQYARRCRRPRWKRGAKRQRGRPSLLRGSLQV